MADITRHQAMFALFPRRSLGMPTAFSAPVLGLGPPDRELAALALEVSVGLQAGRTDSMQRQLLIPHLGVAGHTNRADHLAVAVAELHAAAFGEQLVAARLD